MAGRSGAAAIQLALKEAATGFSARAMAKTLRAQGCEAAVADALERCTEPPELQSVMVEGAPAEYYLLFCGDGACARKLDVDTSEGYGVQIELLESGEVRGVSIFLE